MMIRTYAMIACAMCTVPFVAQYLIRLALAVVLIMNG